MDVVATTTGRDGFAAKYRDLAAQSLTDLHRALNKQKGIVDDDTRRRLSDARSSEPGQHRKFILPCVDYGWSGQGINAMTIASKGGTAWEHPNGLWAYIVDAKGRLVCNYRPQVAQQIYQPLLPLRPSGDGKFRWHSIRGGG